VIKTPDPERQAAPLDDCDLLLGEPVEWVCQSVVSGGVVAVIVRGLGGGEEGIRDPFVSQGELLQRYNGIVMEKNIR